MPVEAHWDNDAHTVIRYEVYGHWTVEEFWVAYEQGRAMINSVEHRVDFIQIAMDELATGYVPSNYLSTLSSMYRNAHPRAGRTIGVPIPRGRSSQVWVRILTNVVPQIRQRVDFADTLEEARAKLAEPAKSKVNKVSLL